MPNEANVDAPVTLIAHGRSGTSLLMQVFKAHPEFAVAGETADLVFGPWHAVERSEGITHPIVENGRRLPVEERAGRVVRSTFLTLFPDDRPRWMHKPINMPLFRPHVDAAPPFDVDPEWYWRALRHSFPRGSFVTILRSPFDVVLSSMSWHGWPEQGCWDGVARVAYVLAHEASAIGPTVVYDELVADPETTLRRLFDQLGVEFHPRVLEATRKLHVPARGREEVAPGTSRADAWHHLDPDAVTPEAERAIAGLWSRHGARFDVPAHFLAAGRRFDWAPS